MIRLDVVRHAWRAVSVLQASGWTETFASTKVTAPACIEMLFILMERKEWNDVKHGEILVLLFDSFIIPSK